MAKLGSREFFALLVISAFVISTVSVSAAGGSVDLFKQKNSGKYIEKLSLQIKTAPAFAVKSNFISKLPFFAKKTETATTTSTSNAPAQNSGNGNGQSSQGQQGQGMGESQSQNQGDGSSFQCLNLAEEKKCIDGEGVHQYCTNVDGCYTTHNYYCGTGENGIQKCVADAVPAMCKSNC